MKNATRLGGHLDEADRQERRRALRRLLAHPLITADGAFSQDFILIRRHRVWLSEWFSRRAGWRLRVDSETARLHKTPADTSDGTRAALDRNQREFTRRRYVLLCLVLAALEQSDRQITLHSLAEKLESLYLEDPELLEAGFGFDLSIRNQRRDLVEVMRFLMDRRVLLLIQGNEEHYVIRQGDVLYNVNRPILAMLPNLLRGPSTVESEDFDTRLSQITAEPVPETDDARKRAISIRLYRQLLEDPVLYLDRLTTEEQHYLRSQRYFIMTAIAQDTGLIPEIRSEGLAMVDDRGDLTDLGLPEEGTDGHITLLLAEFLANQVRADPNALLGWSRLIKHTEDLIARHGKSWRKDVRLPGAAEDITKRLVKRLHYLRLAEITEDGVRPLPAVARYALEKIIE